MTRKHFLKKYYFWSIISRTNKEYWRNDPSILVHNLIKELKVIYCDVKYLYKCILLFEYKKSILHGRFNHYWISSWEIHTNFAALSQLKKFVNIKMGIYTSIVYAKFLTTHISAQISHICSILGERGLRFDITALYL